jgi:hypothetical protein
MALAILGNPLLPQPALLDAIRFAETGHLSPKDAKTARSRKDAIGPYQFLERNLHDMGYKMPPNIPVADVQNEEKARELADRYVTGYSDYHNFTTPLMKLVAYNMGPQATEAWLASGGRIPDLPRETQEYITRAAGYLSNNAETKGNQQMASFMSMPSEDDGNVYMDGTVINPKLQTILDVTTMLDNARHRNVTMPPSSYMAPAMVPQQPVLSMGIADEGDPNINIDGTPVNDNAILNQVGKAIGGALSTDASANAPLNVTPHTQQPMLTTATPQIYRDQRGEVRRSAPVTQNRRDMSAMSMVAPPQQIGMNEMLIRMGAAGLGASSRGGLEALEAIGKTYGEIQDANRATGLAAYQAQMDALEKGASSKQDQENMQRIGQIDETLYDMDRALNYLERDDMSLTGFFDATFGATWDNIVGNPESAARLLLKKLKVDDTLLRVAQTKGAISNKEMDLFMSPAPSDYQDEQVWIDWIKQRQRALRDVRSRLASGTTVADPASASQVDMFSQQGQGDIGLSQDDQSLVNKYLN